ncbi:MAG TPA: hypothetical protein VHL11_16005, partial [Phototrophicaceae bacterium]|nr:hypothetical protein [Phototrophicaceae bacterium]
MQRRILSLVMMLVILALSISAAGINQTNAQSATATPTIVIDPNLVITYPPAVYVVRGQVEIRGTANLPGMLNYFLEFR